MYDKYVLHETVVMLHRVFWLLPWITYCNVRIIGDIGNKLHQLYIKQNLIRLRSPAAGEKIRLQREIARNQCSALITK